MAGGNGLLQQRCALLAGLNPCHATAGALRSSPPCPGGMGRAGLSLWSLNPRRSWSFVAVLAGLVTRDAAPLGGTKRCIDHPLAEEPVLLARCRCRAAAAQWLVWGVSRLGVLLRMGLEGLEVSQQGEEHRVGEEVALDSFISGEVLGS